MSAKPRYRIQPALAGSALKLFALIVAAGSLSLLAACTSIGASSVNPLNWITPYKVDVIQGNFISKEQVEALQVGMTRPQVKEVLGTPLVASLFHADRWDYVFRLRRQGVEFQSYKYTVFFKNDQLERFEGDTMPSEAEFISKLDNKRKLGKVPVLEATEEQLNKVSAKSSPTKSASDVVNPASGSGVFPSDSAGVVVYPPLESPRK